MIALVLFACACLAVLFVFALARAADRADAIEAGWRTRAWSDGMPLDDLVGPLDDDLLALVRAVQQEETPSAVRAELLIDARERLDAALWELEAGP